MAVPKQQKALVIADEQTLKITTIPVPTLSEDEILIKVRRPHRDRQLTSGRVCGAKSDGLEALGL